MDKQTITRCPSCDGYGWMSDETSGKDIACSWCAGNGYVYRDQNHIDHVIPDSDYAKVAEELETLELERLRDMGYSGNAKKPWYQEIRQGRNLLNQGDDSVFEEPPN